jgi:pimeloyl-ACP methyl ester carboxylesterase
MTPTIQRTLKVMRWGLVAVLLVVGGFIAATWAPDRTVDELRGRWAAPPSRFIRAAGQDVHVRDQGPAQDPLPLVLLHGTSASLHTWDGWVERLVPAHRVVRFDLPGFGLTGPAADGDYTIDAYVRFTVAVMDALGIRRAVLAGNSLGGDIAWQTAVQHPERVARLILVDAGGYRNPKARLPVGFRIARTPVLKSLALVTLPRFIVASSVRNVYGDPGKVTPELVDRYYELTLRAGNRASLPLRFQQARHGEREAEIRKVAVPTLILWGGQDRLISPDHADRFQKDIAGSTLVRFDDLGHVPHEEDPARTAAAVQRFLGR